MPSAGLGKLLGKMSSTLVGLLARLKGTPAPRPPEQLPPGPPPPLMLAPPAPTTGTNPWPRLKLDLPATGVRQLPELPVDAGSHFLRQVREELKDPHGQPPHILYPMGLPRELEPWPELERWELDTELRRKSPRSWRNGYIEPDRTLDWSRKVRRQYLLRTDLPRLRYPAMPPVEQILKPRASIERPRWLEDAPEIHLDSEQLRHDRIFGLRRGMPTSPDTRWRSLMDKAQNEEER